MPNTNQQKPQSQGQFNQGSATTQQPQKPQADKSRDPQRSGQLNERSDRS